MSDEQSVEKKLYEERLQRRLKILMQHFESGKVHIAEGLNIIESLKRVRYAPDGTVDLDTVDGLVRSMALGIEAMHDREEMKNSVSLADIQSRYFEFLEKSFGDFHKVMTARNLTPHDVGIALSRTRETVNELTSKLQDFLSTIGGVTSAQASALY